MSQHKSLKTNKWKTKRSVNKRWERLAKLNRTLKWVEGMSVYGLPKEKILRIKLKIKEKKETLTEAQKMENLYQEIKEPKSKKKARDDKETRRR